MRVHLPNILRYRGRFGEPGQWRFGWKRSYTREDWLDKLPTHAAHK